MYRLASCLLLAAWMLALPAAAETLSGTVIVVIDGDTLLFKPGVHEANSQRWIKVRLAGIDAPEKDQPFGEAATRALSSMVLHQAVNLRPVAIDTFGRTLAYVQKHGVQINAELVRAGLAWPSSRLRRDDALSEAWRLARDAQRGLWAEDAPTPPWIWRKRQAASGS